MRPSGRTPSTMRAVTLETGFSKYAEGSCLAKFGDTLPAPLRAQFEALKQRLGA